MRNFWQRNAQTILAALAMFLSLWAVFTGVLSVSNPQGVALVGVVAVIFSLFVVFEGSFKLLLRDPDEPTEDTLREAICETIKNILRIVPGVIGTSCGAGTLTFLYTKGASQNTVAGIVVVLTIAAYVALRFGRRARRAEKMAPRLSLVQEA